MNRFRTKKKNKEAAEGVVRGSLDSETPAPPAVKHSKTFRLGKKHHEPEPKVELDVANALPSSDDFRTSLLMSGLSARFSMLREQDDPKSKIGKASDDSVLFPSKRQSRLNDFGFQSRGLSDIAEVSSINGSIRPPFANTRTDSYDTTGSDGDSLHGSIMNRSKPGEGNNLFGGRQKIYKIPVGASGSTKSLADGPGSGGMGGRALYENDVSQSAFQKLRERERQQEREEHEAKEQNVQSFRSESPPLSGYNRNRETSSTTSSGGPSITRSSTAATSFTSQRTPSLSGSHTPITPGAPPSATPGVERTMTKGRRLYETGLDQHLHEQQFSAMNRIDILTRQRAQGGQTPPPGLSSPTTFNPPTDRWERHQIAGKASLPNMRAASPSPTVPTMGNFDFGVKQNGIVDTKQPFGIASPPLSPPMSENDDHAILAVQPNDRGKATAMGAFSKPVQPYDENKYTQRQLQMQQGRETPPLRKHSPPHAFVPRQQQMGRNRGDSNVTFGSERSRSNSSAQRQFLPQGRIPEIAPQQATAPEEQAIKTGTFLSSPNGSSLGSVDVEQEPKIRAPIKPLDLYNKYRQEQPIAPERPPESQHPAHRQKPFEAPQPSKLEDFPAIKPRLRIEESPEPPVRASEPPEDSPTLGPTSGLSGMVRQHLRSDSNTSSVYGGMPSAGLVSRFPSGPPEPMPQNDYSTRNNPWEVEEWDQSQSDYDGNNFHLEAALNGSKPESITPAALAPRSPNVETVVDERMPSWEKEIETHHTRDGSSETQKERQDFKNDLAARRRRVQENLKSFVETDSRSPSPLLGVENAKDSPSRNNALGLLKTKSSRGSLVIRSKDSQSKAMKMLGIGNATISSSPSPGKSNFDEDSWKHEEEEMLHGVSKGHGMPPQTKAFRQARRDAQRDRERQLALRHQQKMAAEASGSAWSASPIEGPQYPREPSRDRVPPNIRTRHRTPSRERRPPPVTISHRNGGSQESQGSVGTNRSESRPPSRVSRDRSSSDASGRSKSRNGRYRDDLAKAMAEGTASSSQTTLDELNPPSSRLLIGPKSPGTPAMAFQPSPIPSPMMGSNVGPRNRSNSKTTAQGYFESQNLKPLQIGGGDVEIGASPRPSPLTPFSINSTPSLAQPSPGPSSATTPTGQGFQSQGRIPTARKRSINKSEISEPRFISSTSRITTVNLPPGSSLQNGSEVNAPPIPAVNPKRKTRAMFGFGKKDESEDIHSLPAATQSTEEMSTFSADEGESKPKPRQKLRKSSSEGGNLNARARQAAIAAPSPALPGNFPPAVGGSPPRPNPMNGGMF